MKYIRTKDGRILDFDKLNEVSKLSIDMAEEPIREAETIEELCDEGVIEVKFGSTGYIAHFNKNIDELKKFLKYLEECQPVTKDE